MPVREKHPETWLRQGPQPHALFLFPFFFRPLNISSSDRRKADFLIPIPGIFEPSFTLSSSDIAFRTLYDAGGLHRRHTSGGEMSMISRNMQNANDMRDIEPHAVRERYNAARPINCDWASCLTECHLSCNAAENLDHRPIPVPFGAC